MTSSESFHGITSYTNTIRDVLPKRQAYSRTASKCQHQSTKPHGDTSQRAVDLVFTSKRIYTPLHANRLPPENNRTNVPVKHTSASSSTFIYLFRSVSDLQEMGLIHKRCSFSPLKYFEQGCTNPGHPGDIHAPGGIRTSNVSNRTAADPSLSAAIGICITSIKCLIFRWCITFEGFQYGTCSMLPLYSLEF